MKALATLVASVVMLTALAAPSFASTSCGGEQFEVVKQGRWNHGGTFCVGSTQRAFTSGGDFFLYSSNGNVKVRFNAAPNGPWIGSTRTVRVPNPRRGTQFDALIFIGQDKLVFRNVSEGKDLPGKFR